MATLLIERGIGLAVLNPETGAALHKLGDFRNQRRCGNVQSDIQLGENTLKTIGDAAGNFVEVLLVASAEHVNLRSYARNCFGQR